MAADVGHDKPSLLGYGNLFHAGAFVSFPLPFPSYCSGAPHPFSPPPPPPRRPALPLPPSQPGSGKCVKAAATEGIAGRALQLLLSLPRARCPLARWPGIGALGRCGDSRACSLAKTQAELGRLMCAISIEVDATTRECFGKESERDRYGDRDGEDRYGDGGGDKPAACAFQRNGETRVPWRCNNRCFLQLRRRRRRRERGASKQHGLHNNNIAQTLVTYFFFLEINARH